MINQSRAVVLAFAAMASLAYVAAECPNACSGHGDCSTNHDFCQCYNGWTGNDCGDRVCAFGLSWIDSPIGDLDHDNSLASGGRDNDLSTKPSGTGRALNPNWAKKGYWERHPAQLYGDITQTGNFPFTVKAQEGHFYAECSNRGTCDRSTGLCNCFDNYGGVACNRTMCPNDCSGHGTCESMTEITPSHLYYDLWDSDKQFSCVCDGGYFGLDCSMRKCQQNDDPLTIGTSVIGVNDGLLESAEVQEIVVRCPYGGSMWNPVVQLVYTDEFGDEYETSKLDLGATTAADIATALKALPNQVLADYVVDGVTLYRHLNATTPVELYELATQAGATTAYKVVVRFDESMGDVAPMSIRSHATCSGGVRFTPYSNATQNRLAFDVAVTVPDIGPTNYFKVVVNVTENGDAGSSSTALVGNYQYYNQYNELLGVEEGTAANGLYVDATGRALPGVEKYFGHEASNVKFGLIALSTDEFYATDQVVIEYFPDAVADVNVQMVLPASTDSAVAAAAFVQGVADSSSYPLTLGWADSVDTTAFTPIDYKLVSLGSGFYEYYVNGEEIGVLDWSTAPSAATIASKLSGSATRVHWGSDWIEATLDDATGSELAAGQNSYYTFSFDSDVGGSLTQVSSIGSAYINDGVNATIKDVAIGAPRVPLHLIFQFMDVSGSTDMFRWKVNGDANWVDNSGSYYSASDSAIDLVVADWKAVTGVTEIEKETIGEALSRIQITFSGGEDYDKRVCGSADANTVRKSYRYLILGTNGINDSPECSGRGLCDYSSGVCKCFKGYADIDCRLQNALAGAGTTNAV